MNIERIEPQWTSPEIRDYVESLQREIAKAMAIPEYMLHRQDLRLLHMIQATRATSIMRAELNKLINEHLTYVVFGKPE